MTLATVVGSAEIAGLSWLVDISTFSHLSGGKSAMKGSVFTGSTE